MAAHVCKLHGLLTRFTSATSLRHVQGCLVPIRHKSSESDPPAQGSKGDVEIGVTSDGKTFVCFHPTADIPYEFTLPIERPDPLTSSLDTHDMVLKAHLSKEVLKEKGPSIEELSKMFFTTKHRWYPVGQYHSRRIKKNPPKDR